MSIELEFFKDYKVADTDFKLNACTIGCYYKSFIGNSVATELTDKINKYNVLKLIIDHCSFEDYEIDDKIIMNTAVFEIRIKNYSVKGNLY